MSTDETPTLISTDPGEDVSAPSPPIREVPWTKRLTPRLAWLVTWGTKGSLALTDQALFAGAQFALNILLARWLAPAEYGAFAVAYSVFLLLSAIHVALLIEPMLVFGSDKYANLCRSYLGIVMRAHWGLTILASALLLAAGAVVARELSQPVGHALFALSFALPLVLLTWLTRRAFYIELRPGYAAAGGAVFFCALLAIVCGLRAGNLLTPVTAILAMGAAAAFGAAIHLAWLRPQWFADGKRLSLREIGLEHWNYGRWVLAAVFPSWTLLNLYYLALPIWFGLQGAGALKAIMNLAMPATNGLIAFGVLAIPLLVRHRRRGGLALMRRTVTRITGLFLLGGALYFAILYSFRIQIIHLLYGGKYANFSGLPVLMVGLVPLVTACSVGFGGALRSLERPDLLFRAYMAGSVLALTLGLWLAVNWGIVGATVGYLAAYAIFAGALWYFYRKVQLTGA